MKRVYIAAALLILAAMNGCVGIDILAHDTTWKFKEATTQTGLEYKSRASGVGNGNAGVYVADFNNDGWPDVLAIGGNQPVLFKNSGGKFERVNGFPTPNITVQGALFFDADGDGWEDLLLLPRHGKAVFLKNDRGTFTHSESGLEVSLDVAVGATTADYDGDGDLDVFVIQYGDWANTTPAGYFHSAGYIADDNGNPNILFENTETGFERVSDAGITGNHWSLATSFTDLTGDGQPDIHVANDFNNDILYVNRGNGSFKRIVMGNATSRNGMSSEVGYFNGDQRLDIFITNIYFPLSKSNMSKERYTRLKRYFSFVLRSKRINGNNLLINQGDGEFSFESRTYGVRKGGWGWAAVFTDLDNDMDRDLFQTTQTLIRIDEKDPQYTYPMLWERVGKDFENRDTSELGFKEINGRGVVSLDYDHDGDMDLIVAAYNDEFVVYENTANRLPDRNSIQIRATEANGMTTAIGAKIRVTVNGTTQYAVQNAKAGYQSQETRVAHFGLGANERIELIRVVWPDGTRQTIRDVRANQRILVLPNGTIRTRPLESDSSTE